MHQLGSINILLYRFIFSTNERIESIDTTNGILSVNGRNVWEDEEQNKGVKWLYELYVALEWIKAQKEFDVASNGTRFVNNVDGDVVYNFLVRCHESLRQYLCSRDMTVPAKEKQV